MPPAVPYGDSRLPVTMTTAPEHAHAPEHWGYVPTQIMQIAEELPSDRRETERKGVSEKKTGKNETERKHLLS